MPAFQSTRLSENWDLHGAGWAIASDVVAFFVDGAVIAGTFIAEEFVTAEPMLYWNRVQVIENLLISSRLPLATMTMSRMNARPRAIRNIARRAEQ